MNMCSIDSASTSTYSLNLDKESTNDREFEDILISRILLERKSSAHLISSKLSSSILLTYSYLSFSL